MPRMKRVGLICAALFFLSCGVSTQQIQATVSAGIAMTQTAAVPTPSATQAKPPPAAVIPITPTPAPPPLDLGAATRILLQTGRCTPAGSPDCQWQTGAGYVSGPHGEDLKKIDVDGEVIGVSPDGTQLLIAIPNPNQSTYTLGLYFLADSGLVGLAKNFRYTNGCDANHCAAIWLADGTIAFIGEFPGQNNQPTANIFIVKPDGSGVHPLLGLAPTLTPLFLYRSNDKERVYWEGGSGAVPGGLNSARLDGGDLRPVDGVINPAFSPAGSRVAFLKTTGDLGYQTAFFVSSTNWQSPSTLYTPKDGETIDKYSWSADGERLVLSVVSCSGTCTSKHYFWKTSATSLQELPAAIGKLASPPLWTADGRYILYSSHSPDGKKQTFLALNTEVFSLQPFLEKIAFPEPDLEVETFYVIP